jgi:hypothetical protein
VYDREIVVGQEWRSKIFHWLFECPVAIVLSTFPATESRQSP